MLNNRTGGKIDSFVSDYVVFDLETTGISCGTDDIVEISAISVKDSIPVDEFSTLVNPLRPIPYYASRVNGITDEMVADSPVFEDVLPKFLEFIKDSVLVGHNIHAFDLKFLYRYCKRFYGRTLGNDYIDTLILSRTYLPDIRHHSLTDIALHYDIDTFGAHRALNDCAMNQKIYEKLKLESKNTQGLSVSLKLCPRCGNLLKKRNGKFGAFLGCTSYPDCRYTENCFD